MITTLFLEPKGKAREQIALHSSLPSNWNLFLQWKDTWISKKEFDTLLKKDWPVSSLGEIRKGKILQVSSKEDLGKSPFKGKLVAFRSFALDASGGKKKLAMVLFGKVKANLSLDDFTEFSDLASDEIKDIKTEMKNDPWAPMSIWHAPPVKKGESVSMSDVIANAVRYAKILISGNPQSEGWSQFVETEIYK
ncbi:MAG: hypothetical protein P1Q69_10105 [Candidatus Thorarchaeota archaeon]|nr:hypothetical protein [Candidatus Thorarchaeota archaeon]